MGAAEVISFEEGRARKPWSALRHQLHERFDQWLATLEQAWREPPATLSEVTATVWDLRQQRTRGHHGDKRRACPRGGRPAQAGQLSEVYACAPGARARRAHGRDDGGAGCAGAPLLLLPLWSYGSLPLAEALGWVAGCKQLDRQHAAATLVTEVP